MELVNALEQEKAHGKAGQIALKLMYVDLVILDLCGVRSYVEWHGNGLGLAGMYTDCSPDCST